MIVLIGGATGVGKSTIAAQVADRLGVVRIISTDSIREVMRAFFSESLMPAIHYSSYEADKAVRIPLGTGLDSHLIGFMEQVEMVNVGVLAVLDRAIEEGTSLVVEGVHLVPGMLASTAIRERSGDAILLPLVVAVTDPALHRSHFLVREQETSGRRVFARYLQGFEEIRKIQGFILDAPCGRDRGRGQREHRRHRGNGSRRAVRSYRTERGDGPWGRLRDGAYAVGSYGDGSRRPCGG